MNLPFLDKLLDKFRPVFKPDEFFRKCGRFTSKEIDHYETMNTTEQRSKWCVDGILYLWLAVSILVCAELPRVIAFLGQLKGYWKELFSWFSGG